MIKIIRLVESESSDYSSIILDKPGYFGLRGIGPITEPDTSLRLKYPKDRARGP
jgi:hypothetical protein